MMVETITTTRYGNQGVTQKTVRLRAVAKNGSYPSDGSDEDNTYAKYSPSASVEITIANPALFGKINNGEVLLRRFHACRKIERAALHRPSSCSTSPKQIRGDANGDDYR
jgi:hypothetical protein